MSEYIFKSPKNITDSTVFDKNMYTCAHCDNDASASIKQEPLCEEHARERLDTLKSDLAEAEDEYNQTKEEYDSIREEFNVKSYGEAEHQLNVENRDDITEDDVSTINELEVNFGAARERYNHLKRSVEKLGSQLD